MFGVPGRHHDKLSDNSLESLKAWEAREDGWAAEAKAIDPARITAPAIRAAYAIARESIESDIGARVCRSEVWNVSQMTGWQVTYGYLVTIQPVGTEQARTEALARWSTLPHYLDTEIANLREGLKLGYTAPKESVQIVIDQISTLAATAPRGLAVSVARPARQGSEVQPGLPLTARQGARAGVQTLQRLPEK